MATVLEQYLNPQKVIIKRIWWTLYQLLFDLQLTNVSIIHKELLNQNNVHITPVGEKY